MKIFFLFTMLIGCITTIFLSIYVIKISLNEIKQIEESAEKEHWSVDIYTDYNRWNNCQYMDNRWF